MKETKVVVIHETIMHSIIKDIATMCALIGGVMVGWVLDIPSLQWVGGLMAAFFIIVASLRSFEQRKMTPQAAANKLFEDYKVKAEE